MVPARGDCGPTFFRGDCVVVPSERFPPDVVRMTLVVLGYVAAAGFGLVLAIPPGFASPIWPAAGIALAATLRWGRIALPGVFLGSFIANATANWSGALGDIAFVATMIGIGATAQAWVAARLVRGAAGTDDPIGEQVSSLWWLLAAGPLACLVNATWSVVWLLLTARISLPDCPFSWITWWAGDTVGVLVFTPLLLVAAAPHDHAWREGRWKVVAGLLLAFVIVFAMFADAVTRERTRFHAAFDRRSEALANVLERDIHVRIEQARTLAGLFEASTFVERAEFSAFARSDLERYPGNESFLWVPEVPLAARAEMEADAVRDGLEGFHFKETAPDGTYVPAGERPVYFPVYYIQPRRGNEAMLGLDLGADPVRLDALASARGAPGTYVTSPMAVTTGGIAAYYVIAPVRLGTHDEAAGSQRGFAIAGVRLADEVASLLRRFGGENLRVRIAEEGEPFGPAIFEPGLAALHPHRGVPTDLHRSVLDIGTRRWQVEFEGAGSLGGTWVAWSLLTAGVIFTCTMVAFVLDGAMRTVRVESLVAKRTAELDHAVAALQHSNLELQRFVYVAYHDLREPLRAVVVHAQLMEEALDGRLAAEARAHLSRIIDSARQTQDLVTGLLHIARVDTRDVPFQPVALADLVDFALGNLEGIIQDTGAQFEVGDLPIVSCDPFQILQVFQNLLSNAVKFRRPDVPLRIRIFARAVDGHWEIAVEDNGIGIEPGFKERVFEIFERLHPREHPPGRGIGLAVCRRVIERHGGRIWVESEPGVGSAFRFTLPRPAGPA